MINFGFLMNEYYAYVQFVLRDFKNIINTGSKKILNRHNI